MTETALESWSDYRARMMKQDPHGLSAESVEVDEALRGYWDASWQWADGTVVAGIFYFNFGAAMKVAKKFGFALPEQNVQNHLRLKEYAAKGERVFSHEGSWRHPAPRDTVTETFMVSKGG